MTKKLVVIGQGYVGLPLAEAAVEAGYAVSGLDVSQSLVDGLNSGVSHIDDISDGAVQTMLAGGYRATTDASVITDADVVVICVPTPLTDGGGPDLGAVDSASRMIATNWGGPTLVVLESTTYPGTTDGFLLPLLEAGGAVLGQDLFLAFSPERVDPGSEEFDIRNTPKLVGGSDEGSTKRAFEFYSAFIDEVVTLKGTREAETAKLLENTYRHVNIALVNEMAKFCHELGIDIWEVIRGAATKPFGFQAFTPGPGVGGHCIPIDPNYLSYEVRKQLGYPFRFVELAQEINNSMPWYVASRIAELLNDVGRPVRGSRILLLGATYKKNISDQRESPSAPLARRLLTLGADLSFHDPFVERWNLTDTGLDRVEDLTAAVSQADIVVLLQAHDFYAPEEIAAASSIFFDTRGVTCSDVARRL
ncbi:MAG: nucleotide sugar dehydrogenase [Pedococcus sp.]